VTRPAVLIPLLALAALFFGWETYKAATAPILPAASGPAEGALSPRKAPDAGEEAGAAPPPAISPIVARPLFRPDRRPFRDNAPVAARRNYEAEISRFTVLGVVMMEGSEKAIVTERAGARGERYEVGPGDELPGFTVIGIRPDGVVLSADGREFTLPLYGGSPRAPGGGPPPRTELPRPAVAPPPAAGRPAAAEAGAAQPSQPTLLPGARQPRTVPRVRPARPPDAAGQEATDPARPRPTFIPGRR
jgi:hypothetical protein